MKSERKNIVQPSVFWRAFEIAAKAEDMNLSQWMAEKCVASLPQDVADNLPNRREQLSLHRTKK